MMMFAACFLGVGAMVRKRMLALQEEEHELLEAQWDRRSGKPRKGGRTAKHEKPPKRKNGRQLIPNYDPFEGTYNEPEPPPDGKLVALEQEEEEEQMVVAVPSVLNGAASWSDGRVKIEAPEAPPPAPDPAPAAKGERISRIPKALSRNPRNLEMDE